MRDPRDVVISEFKMRTEVYKTPWVLELSLEEYVQHRFEVRVVTQTIVQSGQLGLGTTVAVG